MLHRNWKEVAWVLLGLLLLWWSISLGGDTYPSMNPY